MAMIVNNLPESIKDRLDLNIKSSFDDDLSETVPVAVLVVGVPSDQVGSREIDVQVEFSSLLIEREQTLGILHRALEVGGACNGISEEDYNTLHDTYVNLYALMCMVMEGTPNKRMTFSAAQIAEMHQRPELPALRQEAGSNGRNYLYLAGQDAS